MAHKKTLKTYTTAYTAAKSKYNKKKSIYIKNKATFEVLTEKYKKAPANKKAYYESKLKAARLSKQSSYSNATKAYNKVKDARKALGTFKKTMAAEKRKASLAMKRKVFETMKKEKPGYWASKRPYIIPKYPGTIHSYVYVDNTSETETTATEVTTNALSPGQYINHFTQTQPIQRQIEGKLGGSATSEVAGLKKQFNNLRRWAANGTEIEFRGQKYSSSAVITSATANFDQPRDNALAVSIAIQDVKWAASSVKKKSTNNKKVVDKGNNTGKKVPNKGNRKDIKSKAGKYLTIKKGDTYWAFHLKFGSSVSQLRSWNGFPDNSLPIGKKIRVK